MVNRITIWTTRFLSYAGWLQLIKSVLFSIQTFWTQVFIIPKKIMRMVEAVCRRFLWTGSNEGSNRALMSWKAICSPRTAGGFNVTDMCLWNKAAISKQLWNLCHKKDKMRIAWIHSCYIKNRHIWDIYPTQASWLIRKIFKAKVTRTFPMRIS